MKPLFGLEPIQLAETNNKGAVLLTRSYIGYVGFDYLQATDSLGNVVWLTNIFSIQDTSVLNGVDLVKAFDGNSWIISHFKNPNHTLQQKITKIVNGNIVSTQALNTPDSLQPLPLRSYAVTDDNGILQVLANPTNTQFYLQKIDAQSQVIFTKPISKTNFNNTLDTVSSLNFMYQIRILKQNSNRFFITGLGWNATVSKFEVFQTIADSSGNFLQYNHFALPEIPLLNDAHVFLYNEQILNSGKMRTAIAQIKPTQPLSTYFIHDLDVNNATENLSYSFQDSSTLLQLPIRLTIDKAGNLFTFKGNSLSKKNSNGQLLWNRIIFPDRKIGVGEDVGDYVLFNNMQILADSSFYLIGRIGKKFDNGFNLVLGVLVKTNKNGVIYERLIKGNVFVDANKNCTFDDEAGFKEVLIEAKNANSVFYNVTDSAGNYSIPVDNGIYEVKPYLPNNTYWNACVSSVAVNTLTDTTKVNFAFQKNVECPFMNVDISTPYLRRCFENTYQIKYSNNGTAIAENAFIKVALDTNLHMISSTIPWSSVNGNVYTFPLGNIDEQEVGSFSFQAYLACDNATVLGQTHCVQASIFPDSLCVTPDARWDKSNIVVSGRCVGDSVELIIKNTGAGNMTNPKKYYVLEGDFLRTAPQNFQLNSNEEIHLTVAASGNTVTLTAQQPDYYPYPGNATISIEGCNGDLQPGVVNHFLQDNSSPFINTFCAQNIGSYDPNFKAATPVGIDSLHYVTNKTPIKYIVHFQNVGTDTAFTVLVEDSISPLLDVTTLKMGASSHVYTYQIAQDGVLKVTFTNIMLPDSGANSLASNGFFAFTVLPKNDLADNTVFTNTANVYFDFNTAVSTNQVFHTIRENLYRVLLSVQDNNAQHIKVNCFPNPFKDNITFDIDDNKNLQQQYRFILYDLNGKIIFTSTMKNKQAMYLPNLAANTYLFTISDNDKVIVSGKMMKE
ncbi:MAG: T9SS type A sorting domain-containing protein [Chitinophagales bacterium]